VVGQVVSCPVSPARRATAVAIQACLAFCGNLGASNCNQREEEKTEKSYKAHGNLRSTTFTAIISPATLVHVAEELHQQRHRASAGANHPSDTRRWR
jgi:hypothetical protein